MKYGLIPENDDEAKALEANITAQILFDPIIPVIQARALMTAVRIGLFDRIGNGGCTASELAGNLSLDSDALHLLLRVLVAAGYLRCLGNRFGLTELSRASLLSQSPLCLANWVDLNRIHWDAIGNMESTARTGKGIDSHECFGGDQEWRTYQRAMLETARPAADWVATHVPLPAGAERMLDIGGSHGLYSAAICRMNPPMRADVLELPEAIEHCRMLARQEGIDDVVTHHDGNVLTDDLGHNVYDLVFMGNILHHLTRDQSRQLMQRVRFSLRSGGTAAVWDFRKPDPDSEPDIISDGFALFFRITSSSECHPVSEFCDWMKAAGFVDIVTVPSPSHVLITGRVG